MKKILFVTTIPQTLVTFLLPFAAYFKQKGWIVDAMANGIEGSIECQKSFERCWPIAWGRNPFKIVKLISSIKTIKIKLLRQQYDIIHVHTPIAGFIVRYALRNVKHRPKIIYTAHGFHFYPDGSFILNTVFALLEKLAGKWTDFLVVINSYDLLAAKKMQLVPCSNLHYIPGIGIDMKYYNSALVSDSQILALRLELGLSSEDLVLLMVAEFTSQKRQALAVKALFQLQNPSLHLVFAGGGERMREVSLLAEKLRVDKYVHFLGFRTDIPVLIKTANVMLSLSKREGLARGVMEAMALETPIIGSRIRGTEDLLQDNCGLLVSSGCLLELVQAIHLLLNEPALSAKLTKRALHKVQSYEIDKIIDRYSQIYDQVLLK